jgi:PAS domain S-box-containing protein
MIQFKRTPVHIVVFVLALTAAALLGSLLFRPWLDPNVYPLFLAAVLASSWYYGLAGGLLATALSTVAVLFFFLPTAFSLTIPSVNVFLRILSFASVSLLITALTAAWRGGKGLLAATLSSIGDAVIATDKEGRITFMNPIAEALTGWRQHEARNTKLAEVFRVLDESTRQPAMEPVTVALKESAPISLAGQMLLVSKDGAEIPIEDSAGPIRDAGGNLRGVILVFRDVTARRHLEEQLRHSQKMDAVGRLAGGVAGDFNNLLTVVAGYSELLRAELPPASPLHRFAEEIMYAGERAAALTRQLLAFSRGQAAQPKAVDLNSVIASMDSMLRRLLGENIELIVLPGSGLGRVKADPPLIEQIIMNLVANARDAMPNGGKLVLETANVDLLDPAASKKVNLPPGSYVMMAVSDTGIGMDAETRNRLFEPFFTTKEQGQGSGMGLSTVYGIVKQGGGHITVYSQVGCGTIFEVYLPRLTEPVPPPAVRMPKAPRGSETILVVDDENGVRKLVSAILQSNGYTIIEAGSGAAALAAYEKNAHKIDLVLSDIVMPQMNGYELARLIAARNPQLRFLYMSGYRDSPIGGEGRPAHALLHKPFTPDALLSKVREVLDTEIV